MYKPRSLSFTFNLKVTTLTSDKFEHYPRKLTQSNTSRHYEFPSKDSAGAAVSIFLTKDEKVDTCRYDKRDNKLHLNEIPVPSPRDHELLVKVVCASLCHSDVMLFEPNDQGLILGQNPVTIGHEATGIVVSTGSSDMASKFKVGDKVGFLCAVECCFDCTPCRTVHNSYCETGKTKLQGFSLNGYFQEYTCVDARASMVLPDGCTLPQTCRIELLCMV